jgi:TonB family protein
MSPLSLLFSSDEETSRRLAQTLTELEFQVEFCPEIFAAIDKLTSKSFDVIVCDWNEGPEAAFLIKTSRELTLNRSAFTIAIAKLEARLSAQRAGADLVLSQPILPDRAKYALLTCDLFLQRMRSWLPKIGFQASINGFEYIPKSRPILIMPQRSNVGRAPEPSRLPPIPEDAKMLPITPAFAFGSGSFESGTRSILGLEADPREAGVSRSRQRDKKILRRAALAAVFLAVGYSFSEPLRSEGLGASIVAICGRALERTQALLRENKRSEAPAIVQVAQREPAPWRFGGTTRIKLNPAGKATSPKSVGAANQALSVSQSQLSEPLPQAKTTIQSSIPQSLRMSLYGGAMRNVATRVAPSLLAALEPIAVPEDLSARLILQKVVPGYPEQALRAGLQGSVVLQALIGRDGNIRDLKLIRGSFLLGKAAYQAVRLWRYQPWVVNGRAVEAQTFVTVDFRLPQVSQSTINR